MATFVKYEELGNDLLKGVHQFATHVAKILLAAPAYTPDPAANADTGDVTELAAAGQEGYSAGGANAIHATTHITEAVGTPGLWSVKSLASVTWQNTGTNAWAPFVEVVLYNNNAGTASARPLLGYWSQAQITLAASATFTVNFTTGKLFSVNTVET